MRFNPGDRVRVSDDFTWAKGVTGRIGEPPGLVGTYQGPDKYYRETEGVKGIITTYWVVFDRPQLDADGDGPYSEAEIPEQYLNSA